MATGNPMLDDAPVGDTAHDASSVPAGNPMLAPDAQTVGADTPPPSILSRAWSSLADIPRSIPGNIAQNVATAGQPVFNEPVHAPLMAGIAHGMRDVVSTPMEWLTKTFGSSSAAKDLQDSNQAARDQFDKEYGDSSSASIGRVIGQTMATAPVMGVAGRAIAAGANAISPAAGQGARFLLGGGQGGLATRGASLASQGALTGAATGAMTAGPDQSTGDAALQGATAGAVLGPAIGAATYPLRAIVGRAANMVDPDLANWAQKAAGYGISVDPSKLTTNPSYKLVADQLGKLPFSGVDELAQRRNWQSALAQQFGEATDKGITYDVMGRAAKRIGDAFNGIADRTTIQGGAPLQSDLANIAMEIPQYGLTADQMTPLKAQFQNVLNAFRDGNGQITGKAYQNLVQTGGPLDSVISSTDPSVAAFGMKIKNALDSAFQRSAAPEDQAALTEARQQYRALKTVQPLVEQRGATGDVNPSALQQRVIEQSRRYDPSTGGFAYTGGGQMGDLANIGKIFFSPQPESGTAARNLVMGSVLGGGAASALANPVIPLKVGAGLALNRALQTLMRSPSVGEAMVQGTIDPASRGAQLSNRLLVPGAVNLLGIGRPAFDYPSQ